MNITIIRQRYNPHGGAERFVSRVLVALAKRQGLKLHLIARSWEPIQDVCFHRCNPWYWGRLSRDAGFAYFACKTAKALHTDLIQSHERLACCDIYRAGDGVHREWMTQKSRRLPWFKAWIMRINPYHLYVQYAERRMFESERLRAVICNSQMVKREIRRYFRIDASKIHVIYNGVDTTLFHPDLKQWRYAEREKRGIPTDATVYLFVGSGFERKGLLYAIEAFAGLPEHPYLLVVGYDKQEKRYRCDAERRGLAGRVVFCGAQADVRPFYALADAFVLPTLYDPFPNAALEAMACALPVVVSDTAGVAELLAGGEAGYVCVAGDSVQIATAMLSLGDKTHAEALGGNARRIAERYDWSAMGGALEDFYQTLTDTK